MLMHTDIKNFKSQLRYVLKYIPDQLLPFSSPNSNSVSLSVQESAFEQLPQMILVRLVWETLHWSTTQE